MQRIELEDHELVVKEPEDVEKLRKGFVGRLKDGKIYLNPIEAFYLMDIRGWKCFHQGKELSFNELSRIFRKDVFFHYCVSRDWKDRGLFIEPFKATKFKKIEKVVYPSSSLKLEKLELEATYYPESMVSIVDKGDFSFLFSEHWFGQLGVYKHHEKGKLLKLDILETIFLMEHAGIKVKSLDGKALVKSDILKLTKKPRLFQVLYEVYKDWRLRGFVLKSGFKFGAHFRVYLPGITPVKSGKWLHSKHVLHVFPKYERMLVSEWARAIRVAHGVRKTFICCIPGMQAKDYRKIELNFLAYHRAQGQVVNPRTGEPRFVVWVLCEDEMVGGKDFASALKRAEAIGLPLLLAIVGRETDITYYWVKEIELPGSKYQYYEIEWFQP